MSSDATYAAQCTEDGCGWQCGVFGNAGAAQDAADDHHGQTGHGAVVTYVSGGSAPVTPLGAEAE